MSFIDNFTKKVTQGVERAKFEAEKIQRTLRLETELGDLKKQVDSKRLEFGDRALELYRAGMIQSPTLGALLREIKSFQQKVTLKEEELKLAQADQFVDPVAPPTPTAQSVPVSVEPASSPAGASRPVAATGVRSCPNCQFQMPNTAVFCPSCGTRVTGS